MSEANKTILERANAAITRGDYEGFLAFCTDDTEWTFVGDKTLKGKAAVREWMAEMYDEPPRLGAPRLIADGDFVVALGDIINKDATGTPKPYSYCDVWRIEGGKLAELKAFVIESK